MPTFTRGALSGLREIKHFAGVVLRGVFSYSGWLALVFLLAVSPWLLIEGPDFLLARKPEVVQQLKNDPVKLYELENEIRRSLGQIVLGLFGLVALVAAWRRTRALEANVQVAQEGQITERFTRAIDQLGATHGGGSPNIEVRLGGIYALERIARDSWQDHWPIMEVLTAYVRENSTKGQHDPEPPEKPRVDIQAAMTVIGRRETGEQREGDNRLNLQGVHLDGAILRAARLTRVSLATACLRGAYLNGAHLDGAVCFEINLKGASLVGANLKGARLISANLEDARLSGANLEGARLHCAELKEADLCGTNLGDTDLRQEQIDTAYGDSLTKLPKGLKRPPQWH